MSKKLKFVVSHHESEVAELRADRELAVEYLKAAMESLDNPDDPVLQDCLRCARLQKRMAALEQLPLKRGLVANRFIAHYLQKGIQHSKRCLPC